MRDYGIIHSGFWRDPALANAGDRARLLACYLLTCQHGNGLGCFYLASGYVRADLGWSNAQLHPAFKALAKARFALWCVDTEYVLIRNYLRYNPVANGNIAKARIKQFRTVPKGFRYRFETVSELLTHGRHWPDWFKQELEQTQGDNGANGFETVSKPSRNTDKDTDTRKDQNTARSSNANARTIVTLHAVTGEPLPVREDQAGIWQSQFPGVDVERELLKIGAWLDANPKRRKTLRGLPRFVVNWLSRAQDRG